MIYPYKCKSCKKIIEIVKSCKDASREEYCSECENKLMRIFTAPRFNIPRGHYYDFSLGKYINRPQEVQHALNEYNDKNGTDYQIAGNDQVKKPEKKKYKLNRDEIEQLNHIWDQ